MDAIQINPTDNVVVALRPLAAGEAVDVPGVGAVRSLEDVPQGHKMATRAIAAGDNVVKYGLPIGHATCDVAPGTWLHTHNVATNLSGEVAYEYHPTHPVVEPVEPETALRGLVWPLTPETGRTMARVESESSRVLVAPRSPAAPIMRVGSETLTARPDR